MTVTDADDVQHAALDEPMDDSAPSRGLAWLYVVTGAVGLLGAFVIAVEKIQTLIDPNYRPSCSINSVLSCGTIMNSPQADTFGFPNPLIGLVGFPVVITTGVVYLCGFRPPEWFRIAFAWGTAAGVLFIHYLVVVSLYEVGALCPYCMVVWAAMIPLFVYAAVDGWRLHRLRPYRPWIVGAWYAVIAVLVLFRFVF
ncbi:vitamin K epoxide reductase family protein [Nakamurella aerolata]|uniref:Vitamin K epoxide reductase family protein n=1 Tax=Nakamurella aerolata TaxID=1656892 RepID=A0A849AA85_9ACTN|nr:vitamin K epoxide reductase family protein [Nakamurella aerolata]NNG36523.1 vitamin K epoxide reductase family protein [Nakamurella aerolata]